MKLQGREIGQINWAGTIAAIQALDPVTVPKGT